MEMDQPKSECAVGKPAREAVGLVGKTRFRAILGRNNRQITALKHYFEKLI
jgi:hypothetical protein